VTGAVFVEAPARLHFGVLDLRGSLGRWFGGIGAAAPGPTLCVSASPAASLEVSGAGSERAADVARKFLAHYGLHAGAQLHVERTLPEHAGLGSGTQLALAVARALAEVHGIIADAAALACVTGRGRRSAIGTWTFAGGGLVVEGGHRPDSAGIAPLLARVPFPPSWRCVVAVPNPSRGISGDDEAAAFASLPPPSERDVERVAHVVLMGMLPAVADDDIASFGSALTAVQTITGRWFASAQGGTFATGLSEELVRRMAEWGAAGVGQSSWGPAVYGIVEGEEAGLRLAERVRGALRDDGSVHVGPFRSEGARMWRTDRAGRREGQD
jgi:beta-ribofuranosylaminobenzene 5'-phosphate synthase